MRQRFTVTQKTLVWSCVMLVGKEAWWQLIRTIEIAPNPNELPQDAAHRTGENGMIIADLLVQVAASGRFCGFRPGMMLAKLDEVLPLPFADQVTGRKTKALRRDYGLVEFFFEGAPDWTCSGATLQIHRLAHEELLRAARDVWPDIELSSRTPWHEVMEAEQRTGQTMLEGPFKQQGGQCYRSILSPAKILVLDDPAHSADDPIKSGNVWSLSLYKSQWWRT
jgi:hypothetical protein